MKKLLALLLLVSCSVAQAEWTKVSETVSSRFFFDFDRVQRMGKDIVRVWTLGNAKDLSPGQMWMSAVTLEEFDCHQRANRYLSSTFYSGLDGLGRIISTSSDNQAKWTFVIPDSASEGMLNTACAIK